MRGYGIPINVIDRMVDMYVDGIKVQSIAASIGVSDGCVRRHLKNRGVYDPYRDTMSRYKGLTLDREQIVEIINMYRSGTTIMQIASEAGYSYGFTRSLLLHHGVDLRRRGRRAGIDVDGEL